MRAAARVRRSRRWCCWSRVRWPTCIASSTKCRRRCWSASRSCCCWPAAGGLWLASIGLRPITDMARRAARIAPTGLEDLGQTDRTDELGQLARRVQRAGRAASRDAADAAAVHGRCLARAADAGVGGARDRRRHAEPRSSRRGRIPRGADDRRRPGAAAGPAGRRHAGAGARRCRRLSAAAGRSVSRRSRRRLPARRRRARDRARRHDSLGRRAPRFHFAATRICCAGWC